MKSLILKDLYNIGNSVKSLLFTFVVIAVGFIPTSNFSGYIIMCAIICSMMISTTFAFDDYCKWTRYAMIMPVSKKDLVTGKFIVLSIFCMLGTLFGLVVSLMVGLVMGKVTFDFAGIIEMLFFAMVALAISLVIGSTSIPLIFKFGTEKARMLLVASLLIPAGVCFGIYQLLGIFGINLTEQFIILLICCSLIIALFWCYVTYQISCRIFEKQEL